MSQYKDFLSPGTNVTQKVFTPITRQKLIDKHIIQERTNERGFDILIRPGNTILPVTFPDCQFHQIPHQLDSRAFLEYLGIKLTFSDNLFLRIFQKNDRIVDGEVIYNCLKTYIRQSLDVNGEIWQNKFGEGVSRIQIPIPIIIDWLGFDGIFLADFFRLKIMVFHNSALINYYLIEERFTNSIYNLNLIDFIFATLLRRLENLKSFENAARVYLNREHPTF